jgi:energy-coupling factor transport system ATP-binding protein
MKERYHDAMVQHSVPCDLAEVREQTLRAALENRLVGVKGDNFSGRTRALVACATKSGLGIVLPPETYNVLSGLTLTVSDELRLHGLVSPIWVQEFLNVSMLDRLADRNPYTLSGGEQVCLALLCSVIRDPQILAIDTVFEQLAPSLRNTTLMWLLKASNHMKFGAVLADNRIDSFNAFLPSSVGIKLGPPAKELLDVQKLSANAIHELPELAAYDLTISSLSFGYEKQKLILDNANLELRGGHVYVLEGVNGAGKSTFAKLLVGALRANRGFIAIAGRDYRPWKQPGRYFSYHFQNPDVQLFENTVEEELRKAATQSSDEWRVFAAAFGLSRLLHEHPLDLPFVIRKRVAIAAALTRRTHWVILDEPTIGQDNAALDELVAILKCLAYRGTGVIVISHAESISKQLGATRIRLDSGSFQEVVEGE